uniref:Uncharacterized protein n=1 Tax=Steinernema glaseri TaxID=37863 RepID=A0A1I8AEV4_9BILA
MPSIGSVCSTAENIQTLLCTRWQPVTSHRGAAPATLGGRRFTCSTLPRRRPGRAIAHRADSRRAVLDAAKTTFLIRFVVKKSFAPLDPAQKMLICGCALQQKKSVGLECDRHSVIIESIRTRKRPSGWKRGVVAPEMTRRVSAVPDRKGCEHSQQEDGPLLQSRTKTLVYLASREERRRRPLQS